jgi:glutathione S-transferase
MHEIILHHYPASPFTEKVRLTLGLKGLAWRAVEQPNIMPKPDLLPLTGAYRKIPVMQIGADVYCDSQCIIRELERRHPTPTVHPNGEAISWAFTVYGDKVLFMSTVVLIFGMMGDQVDPAFIEDRTKLMGGAPFNPQMMKAGVPIAREGLRAQLTWLESQLSDGRSFIGGNAPGLADFTTYHPLWFLQSYYPPAGELLKPYAKVNAWLGRVKAIGHATMKPMTPKEALEVARKAEPETREHADPGEPNGLKPGDTVTVMADDYGRDPISGTLVASSPNEIALRRSSPEAGDVVVHFPRVGFIAMKAG